MSMRRSAEDDSRREGIALGVAAATSTWIWVAVVDAIVGEPFRTFTMLGGLVVFTAVHYLLHLVYGLIVVSAVRGASRAPTLLIALLFGFAALEIAIAMSTVLLSQLGLGPLAWVRIFGGSLVGAATAVVMLARTHPLAAQLHRAETED